MLENSLILFRGVSPKKEKELWEQGILTWRDYVKYAGDVQLRLFSTEVSIRDQFNEFDAALSRRDIDYFASRLPRREHFRLALEYLDDTAFLDIETTGLSRYYDELTIVGLAVRDRYHAYFAPKDNRAIVDQIRQTKCIVTFNGSLFDLPFLSAKLPSFERPIVHVDLRFVGRRVGLRGTQKAIEVELGLPRSAELKEIEGRVAPLLWHQYKQGDQKSGRLLLQYNHADVEGMRQLFLHCIRRMGLPSEFKVSIDARLSALAPLPQPKFSTRPVSSRAKSIFIPAVSRRQGARISWSRLTKGLDITEFRCVGIDLTGSEARQSGWCLLEGRSASTKLIATDTEIIEATLAAKPDLVSIDSPLSLPAGRTTVTDDDPTRDAYEIMRECERILRSRGVNVYPALIPSMQKLTARGIRIADILRKAGIPVFKSFPGAAQDIIGIPRKRVSEGLLREGLIRFGLTGALKRTDLAHDELDAVTSALVGIFFWAGRFERIGNDVEDYLIIPDLSVKNPMWKARTIVGLTGPISAGKTTAGHWLRSSRDFMYCRFSQYLETILKEEGKEATRENLQHKGNEIHEHPGQRWFAKQVVKDLRGEPLVAIDGLRFREDRATLVEEFGPAFKLIYVDANVDFRKQRYIALKRSGRDFDRAARDPVEQDIPKLLGFADAKVDNEGTIGAFHRQLGRVINSKSGR